MPLPVEFNTITVLQDYVTFQGNISTGTVTFEPPNTFFLAETSDIAITPKAIIGTLDAQGRMTVVLPFSNDPDITPSFTYHVTENIDGLQRETDIEIPIGLGAGPVKLYDLVIVGDPVITGDNLLTRQAADLLYQAKSGGGSGLTSYQQVEDLAGYPIAFPPVIGAAADEAVAGNDPRLVNQRTPSDLSVTTAKIVDSAVTAAKVAANAITDVKVASGANINLDKTIDSGNRVAMTNTERTKLGTIANGATANSTDAFLLNRANQTGSQPANTISDLVEAVQDILGVAFSGGNVTATYNDTTGTIAITAPAGTGTADPESIRDTIGAAMVGVGPITVTVNDASDTITISTTATTNSTDAQLRDRATHTGAQAISTVTGLQAALDAKISTVTLAVVAGGYTHSMPYATAVLPGATRPTARTDIRVCIVGGTASDPDPDWMIAGTVGGDFRQITAPVV